MEIRRLSEAGGFDVEGVDLAGLRSEEECLALGRLFDEHGLLVFRDQQLTKQQLVDAGGPFGGAMLHIPTVVPDPEALGVSTLSTRGSDGDVIPEDPDKIIGQVDWHTDQGYLTAPNRGKILFAAQVPEEGGMTGFIDGQRTYRALAEKLREQIEGLHVVQSWQRSKANFEDGRKYRRDGERQLARERFEDVVYPIVYPHPLTGEKVLNFPPLWAAGILEMQDARGEELARSLVTHITQPEFQYWHAYRPGDALLWDNWRFLHAASGTPGRYARTMWSMNLNAGPMLARPLSKIAA